MSAEEQEGVAADAGLEAPPDIPDIDSDPPPPTEASAGSEERAASGYSAQPAASTRPDQLGAAPTSVPDQPAAAAQLDSSRARSEPPPPGSAEAPGTEPPLSRRPPPKPSRRPSAPAMASVAGPQSGTASPPAAATPGTSLPAAVGQPLPAPVADGAHPAAGHDGRRSSSPPPPSGPVETAGSGAEAAPPPAAVESSGASAPVEPPPPSVPRKAAVLAMKILSRPEVLEEVEATPLEDSSPEAPAAPPAPVAAQAPLSGPDAPAAEEAEEELAPDSLEPESLEAESIAAPPARPPPPPPKRPPPRAQDAPVSARRELPKPPPREKRDEAPGTERKPPRRPWWEEVFGDDFQRATPRLTDRQTVREVDFIEQALGIAPGGVVLDLGCGTGEHAVELARRGYGVVGYDLSLAQLALAAEVAQAAGTKLNFLQGDMRELAFEEMFDGVFCWNTTFGYFEEEKNHNVLERVFRALRPGGSFLLDVVNRDWVAVHQPSSSWYEGDGCVCMDDMSVDFITSRLRVKRSLILDDGRSRECAYSIRLYSLHELGRVLHDVGFKVTEVTGDLSTPGVFFGAHSARLVVLAQKP